MASEWEEVTGPSQAQAGSRQWAPEEVYPNLSLYMASPEQSSYLWGLINPAYEELISLVSYHILISMFKSHTQTPGSKTTVAHLFLILVGQHQNLHECL